MAVSNLTIVYRKARGLVDYENNTRTHSEDQVEAIKASIREFGFINPVLLKDDDETIGAGHARRRAAVELLDAGELIPGVPDGDTLPTITLHGLTEDQWRAYVIADNRLAEQGAGWDVEKLRIELTDLESRGLDLTLTGFSLGDLDGLNMNLGLPGPGEGGRTGGMGSLAEKFGIPPFSVLNAREGWWQDRKRGWIALGIKSELGRGEGSTYDTPEITSPGLNHYREQAKARTFHDGAVKGQGGFADQVAAAATKRKARNQARGT